MNIIFLAVAGYLYWLYRNRERLGGGAGYAIDPVCGMQVQTSNAPAHITHEGHDYWFCSDRCAERFNAEPGRYAPAPAEAECSDPVQDSVRSRK